MFQSKIITDRTHKISFDPKLREVTAFPEVYIKDVYLCTYLLKVQCFVYVFSAFHLQTLLPCICEQRSWSVSKGLSNYEAGHR